MAIFLWIISVLWIIFGITFLVVPSAGKRFIGAMNKVPKILMGLISCIAGILFLLAAPVSSWSWFIAILGMLGLLKGIFFLLSPAGLVRATISWWMNQGSSLYRLWGILALILAALVISSIM